MSRSGFDAEFDVVVVGAGSAGCVLSARLTENPNIALCAIEAVDLPTIDRKSQTKSLP